MRSSKFVDFDLSFRQALAIMLVVLLSVIAVPVSTQAQANLRMPTVQQGATALNIKWTAGTLNSGGHAITVTAGNTAVTASKTDCSAPSFASCNLLYSNSSGTVAVTATPATAGATGNVLMAYIETDGSAITRIAYPQQAGQIWTNIALAGGASVVNCGTANACSATTVLSPNAKVVIGKSAALDGASPAIATITGISPAFTSSSSYICTATLNGTSAAGATGSLEINYVSSSSFTITAGNGVTATASYVCIGS